LTVIVVVVIKDQSTTTTISIDPTQELLSTETIGEVKSGGEQQTDDNIIQPAGEEVTVATNSRYDDIENITPGF
jgi:hypothetical protein